MFIGDINPDWSRCWTANEAKEELIGFVWKGPGWYFGEHDTTLVYPVESVDSLSAWDNASHEPRRLYRFCIFTGRNPFAAFNAVSNAPVHESQELMKK